MPACAFFLNMLWSLPSEFFGSGEGNLCWKTWLSWTLTASGSVAVGRCVQAVVVETEYQKELLGSRNLKLRHF
jgi:hypothetical protein